MPRKRIEITLPEHLRLAAIAFARKETGIDRPVKAHRPFIEAFEECYLQMLLYGSEQLHQKKTRIK